MNKHTPFYEEGTLTRTKLGWGTLLLMVVVEEEEEMVITYRALKGPRTR